MTELQFWQSFWFILIGAALFLFTWLDGFDLGIGMMLPFQKTPDQRMTLLNVIWPLWDGNELYGLIGGGAIFAAFPAVFAGLLSGLYPWIALVLIFVMLRPVAFEAWLHDEKGKKLWEYVFMACSFMIPFVAGTAIGATMAGLPYGADGNWDPNHSFLETLSPLSVLSGLAVAALCLVHGSAYLIKKTEGAIASESRKNLLPQTIIAAVLTLAVGALVLFGAADLTGKPAALIGVPLALAVIAVGFVGLFLPRTKDKDFLPFLFSSLVIGGVWLLVGAAQFPTMIRSSLSPDFSLTVFKPGVSNPLNSLQFIGVLAVIALAIVLVYSILVYRIFKGKVDHKTNAHY